MTMGFGIFPRKKQGGLSGGRRPGPVDKGEALGYNGLEITRAPAAPRKRSGLCETMPDLWNHVGRPGAGLPGLRF